MLSNYDLILLQTAISDRLSLWWSDSNCLQRGQDGVDGETNLEKKRLVELYQLLGTMIKE